MKKNLLSLICVAVMCCFGNKASATGTYAPYFNGGATQTLTVCENSLATGINTLLAATDSSLGETETWAVLANATHGTLVAVYTTSSTGGMITPTGLTYMPTTGYTGMDSFAVTVSDGTEMDTTMVYVTINPLPVAGTISGVSSVCVGAPVTLTTSGTGGTWSATNGHATVAGGVVSGVSTGADTINYSVSNSCGTAVASHIMAVNAAPVANPVSGGSSVCLASSITLSAPSSGGVWTASNTHASLVGNVVTGVTYGMDTITYIVSNVCGADTATHVVTVDTAVSPISMIVGPDHVCVGSTISLSDSVSGGVWSSLYTSLATVNSAGIVSGVASGADTIVYTITNGCGAVMVNKHINVIALPFAGVISGYDSVCAGMSITLTTTGTPGGLWSSSSPDNAVVSATGVVTGAIHGTTNIIYTVTGPCGTATATFTVNVNVPAAPIIGSNTLCQFTFGVLIDPSPGGTWSVDNILIAGPAIGGNLIGITLGTATVTYTLDNACGTTTATFDIEVIDCSTLNVDKINASEVTLNVTPNPTNGAFTIMLPSAAKENASVVITNMLGQKVTEFNMLTNTEHEVKMDIPAGIYFLSATVNNRQLTTKVIVTE